MQTKSTKRHTPRQRNRRPMCRIHVTNHKTHNPSRNGTWRISNKGRFGEQYTCNKHTVTDTTTGDQEADTSSPNTNYRHSPNNDSTNQPRPGMIATCLKLDVTPEEVTRLGQPDYTMPRIILAVMNNINVEKKVLSKTKEIRNNSEQMYKSDFIRSDLRPRQRANKKKLTGPADAETRIQTEQDLHILPKRNYRDPVNTKATTANVHRSTAT